MQVGFVGLGAMGGAMAANLAKAGHQVKGWARSGASGVDGVEMVGSLDEVVQGDILVTMLPDDLAIRSVLLETGVLAHARAGLVHVVTSTISIAFAGELAAAHEAAGLGYVSAPVLGRPDVAKEGGLNILAVGRPSLLDPRVVGSTTSPMRNGIHFDVAGFRDSYRSSASGSGSVILRRGRALRDPLHLHGRVDPWAKFSSELLRSRGVRLCAAPGAEDRQS